MHIDEQENIFNNDQLLGKFEGFVFKPSDNFEQNQDNDTLISELFIKKIDKFINEGDAALRLNEEFYVTYNNALIAKLLPTDDILKPDFTPILDDRIQGIPLARLALHLESWLKRQLNMICDPLDIIAKTEDLSQESHDFIKIMRNTLGYSERHKISEIVKKISPNDRTKLRKAGVRFAQYSVFVRDMLKPSVQKIKLILWSLINNIPLPELPPSGVVTIPFNPNFPQGYYDIAGYKICGECCVRIDMIEKLADAIRPLGLKSDTNPSGEFEITAQHMSFVGKSGEAFEAILKSLGYNYQEKEVTVISVSKSDDIPTETQVLATGDSSENITEEKTEIITEEKTETITHNTDENSLDSSFDEVASAPESESENDKSDQQSSDNSDNNSQIVTQETVVIKKLWSWSPTVVKNKSDFRGNHKSNDSKERPKFNKFPKATQNSDNLQNNSGEHSGQKEFKPKSKDFKRDKDQNHDRKEGFDKKDNFEKKDKSKHKSFAKSDKLESGSRNKERGNGGFSKTPSPYVNMPKTHKVSSENNPFAALLALKNKE